ncbi:MAG: peroxiredoxin family protein [Alphaproteobacteria bacterium]|nr:peroxiredoxin family protein [Alphaproteobacteria bacterium]
MKRLLAAILAVLAPATAQLTLPAMAEEAKMTERGLAVGAPIPALSVLTHTGATATFDQLKGEKGLVVAFVRSADWCPFCKNQLKDLDTVAADLKARGYPLVALSYDPVKTLATFAEANKLDYTLLSDPDSRTIDAFGLRNEEVRGNKRFNGIPHPAIFIIGADGVVKAKLYEERYQDRPPGKLVVATIDGLR